MSLSKSIQSETYLAFQSLSDLFKDATHITVSSLERDPTTYELDPKYKETPIKCVVTSFSRKEIKDSPIGIIVTDKKILVPGKGLNVDIKVDDEIEIDGLSHKVLDVETDPAGALFICQARA